jgi:hypothetical protein
MTLPSLLCATGYLGGGRSPPGWQSSRRRATRSRPHRVLRRRPIGRRSPRRLSSFCRPPLLVGRLALTTRTLVNCMARKGQVIAAQRHVIWMPAINVTSVIHRHWSPHPHQCLTLVLRIDIGRDVVVVAGRVLGVTFKSAKARSQVSQAECVDHLSWLGHFFPRYASSCMFGRACAQTITCPLCARQYICSCRL